MASANISPKRRSAPSFHSREWNGNPNRPETSDERAPLERGWKRSAPGVCLLAAMFLLLALSPSAFADNAIPIATREANGLRIVLFSHSAPLRAGKADLALMLLDAESGQPKVGWEAHGTIQAVALSDADGAAWVAPCCRLSPGADGNSAVPIQFSSGGGTRLDGEATVILARPGTWRLALEIERPDGARLAETIDLDVAHARTPLSQYWPWFAAIPVVVLGFAFSRR